MSTPANPLSRFRSYSYYHVLALCDSTQTADALSTQSDTDIWKHPTAPIQGQKNQDDSWSVLKEYSVKTLDIQNQQGNTIAQGKYCILINGATDAALSITRAKWSSYTAAQTTVQDQSTSIAVEGEMEISEPKGVVFLDILVNCCLALGIDAANAIFVLKTFFIGYPDWKPSAVAPDMSSSVDSVPAPEDFTINDVEPIMFIAYDVSGNFTEAGGVYQMHFVAVAHGVSRLPQYSKSANGFNFEAGGTLRQTLGNLAFVVERNYTNMFNCVHDTIAKNTNQDVAAFANRLAQIKYTFYLDEHYTDDYKVDDVQSQAKNLPKCAAPATLSMPANMSIEDAIHLIMRSSSKVKKDMSEGIEISAGKRLRYEYKINAAYISSKGSDNKIAHEVQYLIQPFPRPKDIDLFDLAAKADKGSIDEALQKNIITFDYIFTGKNIDILEFDIKLNMGMQYLQVATITNTLKEQLQQTPTSFRNVSQYAIEQLGRFGGVNQIPVMFGTQIRTPSYRNKQSPGESAEAGFSMSKHASIEVQDVSMKIYGNPRLLSSINRTTSPSNLGKADTFTSDTEASFYSWAKYPAFARVNIRMPQNNDDIALFKHDPTNFGQNVDLSFTKEFWFTGLYYVVGIEHEFNVGDFTQTLSMLGIPQSNAIKAINRGGQNQSDFDLQKNISSCYDNTVNPCAPAGSASTAAGDKNKTKALPFQPTGTPPANAVVVQPQASKSLSPVGQGGQRSNSVSATGPANPTPSHAKVGMSNTCADKQAVDNNKQKEACNDKDTGPTKTTPSSPPAKKA